MIQKRAEAIGDLIGNKIADAVANSYNDRTTKVWKNSRQKSLETSTNEHDKEILQERYIPPGKWLEIIDNLRSK